MEEIQDILVSGRFLFTAFFGSIHTHIPSSQTSTDTDQQMSTSAKCLPCSVEDCAFVARKQPALDRHQRRAHGILDRTEDVQMSENDAPLSMSSQTQPSYWASLLTGANYATSSIVKPQKEAHLVDLTGRNVAPLPRKYACTSTDISGKPCLYRFKRLYDLERHLRAAHNLMSEDSTVYTATKEEPF